ncbi:MAG: sulfite oxidase-like oxidoreductase [Cyanobacteria bacterium RYN_339]|nr:sulfite oxidase-like oxidoreductase [Cyanobacteria bacterium RYN_339]
MLIRLPRIWDVPDHLVTPEQLYLDRRRFLRGAGRAAAGLALAELFGCEDTLQPRFGRQAVPPMAMLAAARNPKFADAGRPLSDEAAVAAFNNYYEFGVTKHIAAAAQALPVTPWAVEVGGLVHNPKTYAIEDLSRLFPLEERVYKHRCVEAWSMTVPWTGFPMKLLLQAADPKPEAQFVTFTSYHNDAVQPGPGFGGEKLPWPYEENLRLDEMANELAFFATGIYGHDLPKQHGAPLRQCLPWKYGFKGAKSIVKITFTDRRTPTFWNTLAPDEYDFEANIDPEKPHPRWSQATERVLDYGEEWLWRRSPTLKYNGYGEYVAGLY